MKNLFLVMLFLNITFICSAQNTSANTNSKELKFEDKSKIKTAERNPSEKETEQSVDSVSAEPVIIQRLEYKQDTQKSDNKNVYEVKPVMTHKNDELTKEEDEKTIEEEIELLNNYINAIEKKVDVVRNNPGEHQKAIENGWYSQMKKNHDEAIVKRELLLNSKNKD